MERAIEDFHEYVMGDVLGHVDGITSKKMFGGYGLYLDGDIFAIITSDTDLYFKVDETNQPEFETVGSHQFIYTGHKNKKPTPMPYWIVPESVMEDREKIEEWAHQSALITKKSKK